MIYGMPGFDLSPSLITREQFLYGMDGMFSEADSLMKEAVIYEYTDWADENNGAKNRDAVTALMTDTLFICPVQQFAQR